MATYLDSTARVLADDEESTNDVLFVGGRDDFALALSGANAPMNLSNPLSDKPVSVPIIAVAAVGAAFGAGMGTTQNERLLYGTVMFGATLFLGMEMQKRGWL